MKKIQNTLQIDKFKYDEHFAFTFVQLISFAEKDLGIFNSIQEYPQAFPNDFKEIIKDHLSEYIFLAFDDSKNIVKIIRDKNGKNVIGSKGTQGEVPLTETEVYLNDILFQAEKEPLFYINLYSLIYFYGFGLDYLFNLAQFIGYREFDNHMKDILKLKFNVTDENNSKTFTVQPKKYFKGLNYDSISKIETSVNEKEFKKFNNLLLKLIAYRKRCSVMNLFSDKKILNRNINLKHKNIKQRLDLYTEYDSEKFKEIKKNIRTQSIFLTEHGIQ